MAGATKRPAKRPTKRAAKRLVIVESPAKARTLERYLGKRHYSVRASLGHIRDLPKSDLGVDVEQDFAPKYVIPRDKSKTVTELAQAARQASGVYLATDPDREGEAIAWHLLEAINKRGGAKARAAGPIEAQRIVFHEVTKSAVQDAFQQARGIDDDLVQAQQARRVMDRLIGYKLSPLLGAKVRRGLSAGRVQSPALRMVVEREREIEQFVSEEYWTIEALLAPASANGTQETSFWAEVIQHRGEKLSIATEAQAQAAVNALRGMSFAVQEVHKREQRRHPAAPFTTSTLQQEAGRRLRFAPRRTMRVAQQLYEGLDMGQEGPVGLITYMRTDSTNVAAEALAEARQVIGEQFGKEFVPDRPRRFRTKAKAAQEAHEAIRPTSAARLPESVRAHLTQDQYRLYTLVWKRFVASQMAAAILDTTRIDIRAMSLDSASTNGSTTRGQLYPVHATPQSDGRAQPDDYLLRARGRVVRFPGFLRLYEESQDENGKPSGGKSTGAKSRRSSTTSKAAQAKQSVLPPLAADDPLTLHELKPEQHFTQPPPRYSEASLIRAMEDAGIGRPSTYAPTVSIIQERGYVERRERRLHPTDLGNIVNDLLVEQFPDVVDASFTAKMEDDLDRVAEGTTTWVPVVREFWGPFAKAVAAAEETVEKLRIEDEPTDEICPECGQPMVIKHGRYGRFLACTGFPECRHTRPLLTKLGVPCPKCGNDLVVRRSRRGRTFYGCSGYPDCDFVSWQRPVAAPCPQCGGLQTQSARDKLTCAACGHTHVPVAAEVEVAVPV
ncbi:MAG: type I DNA topoisomerase [Chloroflexota bacterium]|nr:type I DNA topoisomerase [Chloroflexota bacterium]